MKTPPDRAGALENEALGCCGGPAPTKVDASDLADPLAKDQAEAGDRRGTVS